MFQLTSVLACTIFSACAACAAAAEEYSVIPEPDKKELLQETAKTLQLLSDLAYPSLRTDTYRVTATQQRAHPAPGEREGRFYGLTILLQLQDQPENQAEKGIPCDVITEAGWPPTNVRSW